PLDSRKVAGAEQPDMDEAGIEVIEARAQLVETWLERRQRLVSLEEGSAERAEHRGEGKLDLRGTAIDGGIDKCSNPIHTHEHIPRPKIAMQQAREGWLDEVVLDPLCQAFDARIERGR